MSSLFGDRGSGDTLAHPANLAGLLLVSMSGAVEAADLYSGGSPTGQPYLPLNIWTGFYVGANGFRS